MRPTLIFVLLIAACSGAPRGRDRGDAAADAGATPELGVDAGATDLGTALDAGATDLGAGVDAAGFTGTYPGRVTRTASGGVTYELYVPTSYAPSTPSPLVCLFHGQGDTGANIVSFWQSTAEASGFLVLATTSTGSMGGWSGGDVSLFSTALDDALAAYDVDASRIYVWGFSAGAHLVHAIALMNTDVFAAYAVNAGVLDAFAGSSAPASAARRIPLVDIVGTSDPLYAYATSDHATFLSAGWTDGTDLDFETFAGGHELRPEHPAQVWAFVSRFRLP